MFGRSILWEILNDMDDGHTFNFSIRGMEIIVLFSNYFVSSSLKQSPLKLWSCECGILWGQERPLWVPQYCGIRASTVGTSNAQIWGTQSTMGMSNTQKLGVVVISDTQI